jgi:acetylornithine deacetylase/succinyl-diaminopimelate desuccinylase-like protein
MSTSLPLQYAKEHRPRFLGELQELVRFPSISSQSKHAGDVKKCAAWLANHLRGIGLESARMVPTPGNPMVYGAWQKARNRPTVLIYGHYDVLPADPLGAWRTPPFEPTVRGQDLYGRGACDDKGQLFTHVKAIECWLRTQRALPVNVKCLFEGEEEIDSPNLRQFVHRNQDALKADAALVSDSRMLGPGRPAIGYGQRGALRLELSVRGPAQDLHSGNFGGAVYNPLQALCQMVAALHDPEGHVIIPGFYNQVRRASAAERAELKRAGPSDAQILQDAGTRRGWGEREYSLYERTTLRPALTVNGIAGGYQGPGVKAVIPASAVAKLSFRLVPDQDPAEVARLFRRHIARITPAAVRSSVRVVSGARPALLDLRHPVTSAAMRAAVTAYRKGFGAEPVFLRSGGSIPAVSVFQDELGIPTVLMGFALPDDRIHAPNEKFHLPNFYRGIATSIGFLAEAAGLRETRDHPRETRDRPLSQGGRVAETDWRMAYGS